uniref:AN1-type domain-containing protein n=1 Tax=Aureoumbra lagunensis TaxID=44058 RepID=A0A6S8C2M1_9STRA|mmetsp:Transcript_4426/g.5509  ORF Transcript_4426/g.5509 Transcript_4426/m.5509 type:complete len:237 (-) Transcript_4426:79-789(-)|eukprot:CAMPEP_0197301228 /NCGR_PEP_ID=MMETSP0890-20130614/50184_1 /TAXON_ID=44058 ORGANISM="Aureoumbra lagunensis, Strain CCMP1510" /NCGR_SAMPLE_ID=MMETSP0890 /ASSEMBLY_ACC=CAM_ASM_000533 /LENGTH=236 /DNA_ID=CAMNT_0042780477 /DNA_START=86 /DNA_END=796 /DNA_ORIENTATION=-
MSEVRYQSEKEVIDDLLTGENFRKKFLKKKCAYTDCNAKFKLRFGQSSALIVRPQIGTFWCKDCGRLLCEKHRADHDCEVLKIALERSQKLTASEILEQVKRKEEEKIAAEEQLQKLKQAEKEAKAAHYQMWKHRRQIAAGKSTHVTNFVQRLSVQANEGQTRDQLLDLYTSCNRLNLRLWNEVTSPTSQFDYESYEKLIDNYTQIKQISGMICTVDGMPLDLTIDWLSSDSGEQP